MTQKPPFRTRNSYLVVVVRYELVLFRNGLAPPMEVVSHSPFRPAGAVHTDNGAMGARWPLRSQGAFVTQYSCDLDDQLAKVPSL
jgi:hypothetical protein